MSIVAMVGAAVQQLLGPLAEETAAIGGIIRRRRIFSPVSLARTFVLGFLNNPQASDEPLARIAAQSGAPVTPQAIERRFSPQADRRTCGEWRACGRGCWPR